MNLRILGDLSHFWQWDTNRKLVVDDFGVCNQVHYDNLVCEIKEENGIRVADVPNILLQSDEPITAYLYTYAEDGSQTRHSFRFNVRARKRPDDYVYTETEVLNYAYLDERLKKLEGEGLAQAVADYLKDNPVQAGATKEEAEQIAKNKTDIETLTREKLDASKLPEAVNEALAQAKASGEFDGDDGKDGYTPVKGVDYFDGEPGKDGYTPQKGIDYFDGKDGNDYVLTDADKQEIAERAAELVEVPEGGTVTDEQIASSVEDYFAKNPVKGGGLSETAKTLLIAILRNGVYSTDQSANIDAFKTALESSTSGGGSVATTYTVINALTNVTTSNEAATVASGSSYSATLTALDGFAIEEVTILMGNVDVTETAYSGGVITIESVTGNIVITASAVSVNVKTLNDYDYSELANYYTCTFGGEGVSPGIKVQNPNAMWTKWTVEDEYLAELLSNETITIVAAHDQYGFGPNCKATKTGGGGYTNISAVSYQDSVYVDDSGNRYSYATWDISDIKTVITENNICLLEFGMGQAHRYHGVFGMILHNVPNGVVTQEMLLNTIGGV